MRPGVSRVRVAGRRWSPACGSFVLAIRRYRWPEAAETLPPLLPAGA